MCLRIGCSPAGRLCKCSRRESCSGKVAVVVCVLARGLRDDTPERIRVFAITKVSGNSLPFHILKTMFNFLLCSTAP